ncbi:hypothetical protein D9M73_189880 [compost metagenome]
MPGPHRACASAQWEPPSDAPERPRLPVANTGPSLSRDGAERLESAMHALVAQIPAARQAAILRSHGGKPCRYTKWAERFATAYWVAR